MATARFRHLSALFALVFLLTGAQAQELTVSISPNAPSVPEGSSLTLTANVSTLAGVTIQWSRDGGAIPGETGTALTVDKLTSGDDGAIYSVRVDRASDGASATDSTAPLVVTPNLATAFVVQNDASRGPGSILEAINLSQFSGAEATTPRTITFAPGLNGRSIAVGGELLITSNAPTVVDASALAAGITFSGSNARRLFTLDPAGNLELRRVALVAGNGAGSLGSGSGGAIYSEGALRLVGCSIQGSSASTGGAVFHLGDPLELIDSTIRANTSSGAGGGVVAFGGGITIQNCVFDGNSAQGNSGGLRVAVGSTVATVLVLDTLFTENTCTLSGGGGSLNGVDGSFFDFRRCRFERNSASVAGGGLLLFAGSLALTDSSVTGNAATTGAGVYLQSAGTVALSQCTFSNNTAATTASGAGAGAGLFAFRGSLTLSHCTFNGNAATGTGASGGGVQIQAPTTLSLGNSILAGNAAPQGAAADLNFTGGTITVAETCLIGSNLSVETLFPAGPLAGTAAAPLDPRLAPVGLYGGITQTQPPLDLSPALNAATGLSPTNDQRGFPRGVGGASDLGAVERGPVVTVANANGAGAGSLRAAVDAAVPDTRVRFAAALDGQSIALSGAPLLLVSGRAVDIDASNLAAGVRLTGSGMLHVFDVAAGAGLSLRRVSITATPPNGAEPGVAIRSFGGVRLFECDLGGIVTDGEASCLYVGGGVAELERSTFGRGSASGGAGGAIVVDGSESAVSLINCTVANHQGTTIRTGGIVARNGAFLSLLHTTVAGCTGTPTHGIRLESGSALRLERSIVANNVPAGLANTDITNAGGTVTAVGPNLLGVNTTVTGEFPAGPLVGTSAAPLNARLGTLANNGGFTQTFFPQVGSPAIDAAGLSPIDFDQRGRPRGLSGNDDLGSVEVSPNDPASTRLINVSTRLRAGAGVSAPIAGFAIRGSTPKTVAIRALGPTLANFGVPDVMANPTLQLVRASDGQTIATNDDWQSDGGAAEDLTNAGLALPNPLESGLVVTLPEGNYTAVVRGVSDGTGNCLVEVYEIGASDSNRLVNISTRGPAGLDNNVMIAGLVVGPGQSKRVLFRCLGPTLTAFGVTGALQDPTFEVRSGGSLLGENDDWQSSQAAEITASGFAPPDSRESALILTLGPGSYTAVVRGKNGTQGNAIIEVYELD